MLKSSLLSDDQNIEFINREFIPVDYRIEKGFPTEVPALAPVRDAFLAQPDYSGFFATVVVLDSTGTLLLGYTGRSYPPNFKPDGCYRDGRFLANVKRGLDRFHAAQEIQADATLSAEQKAAKLTELQKDVRASVGRLKTLKMEMETP